MSKNRNKKQRYRVQTGTPVSDVMLTVDEEDAEVEPDGAISAELAKGDGVEVDKADAAPETFAYFVPIQKVDAQKREVWGRAAQEVKDRSGEKLDFATSAPLFQKWSDDAYKRSGGKSRGNIRAMHQPIAAGKLLDLKLNATERAFDIGTYIVDENEWQKCLQGVYTGFSVGGRYTKRWLDASDNTLRYTAEPNEISLVDAPCIPTATFTVVKEDGTAELRKFQSALDAKPIEVSQDNLGAGQPAVTVNNAPNPTAPIALINDPAQPAARVPATATLAFAGHITDPVAAIPATEGATAPVVNRQADNPASAGLPDAAAAVSKLENLGQLAGIARRAGAPIEPAAGLSSDWKHYADPANWGWACDTAVRAAKALADYNGGKDQPAYSEGEWAVLGRRLTRLAEAATGNPFVFDAKRKQIRVKQELQKMPDLSQLKSLLDTASQGGDGSKVAVDQAAALVQVMLDTQGSSSVSAGPVNPTSLASTSTAPISSATKATDASSTPGKDTPPALESDSSAGSASPSGGVPSRPSSPSTPSSAPSQPSTPSTPSSAPSQPSTPSSVSTKTPASSVPVMKSQEVSMPNPDVLNSVPASMIPPTALGEGEIVSARSEQQRLLQFIGALERGNVNKAKVIAADGADLIMDRDYVQGQFDEMYHKACLFLLEQGGIRKSNSRHLEAMDFGKGMLVDKQTYKPLEKFDTISENDLALAKADLAKGVSQSTLPGLYLQRLVRIMLPVLTPLRKRLPATPAPQGATTAQWRVLQGFQNTDFTQLLLQPESTVTIGATTGNGYGINETPTLFASPFTRISVNNSATLEAIAAARGYDDAMQFAVIETLSAMLRGEELAILLNNSGSVGGPTSLTAASSATGGVFTPANPLYFQVTSLTGVGWLYSKNKGFNGSASSGESGSTSNSGSALKQYSAFSGSAGSVTLTWPAAPGAVAYNVYASSAGSVATCVYVGTFTTTSASVGTIVTSGSTVPGANTTANSNGWEGITQWCTMSNILGQNIYNKTLVDCAGSALTLVQPNSIAQFDTVLTQLYQNWNITPTLIVCSAQSATYAMKVMGSATNPAQRIFLQTGAQQGQLTGGMYANSYINKFAVEIDGSKPMISILAHPYMPDGMYLFLTETINYPVARETRGFALEVLIPYTYFPFGPQTFNYPFGLIVQETLECFHPGAQAAVVGVNVYL